MSNYFSEILLITDTSRNIPASGVTCRSRGIQSFLIPFIRRYNTVGGHKDWSVKTLKFFFLLPPCIAVITNKMMVFFKSRVIMCRQHFRMSINIHSGAFGLFEQHLHITQIMAGNEYTGIFPHSYIDFCYFWVTVRSCVCFIKIRHSSDAVSTGFKC